MVDSELERREDPKEYINNSKRYNHALILYREYKEPVLIFRE
jgi:hypothetical protein